MPKQHHRRHDGIRYHVMLSYDASEGVNCIYPLGFDDSTEIQIKLQCTGNLGCELDLESLSMKNKIQRGRHIMNLEAKCPDCSRKGYAQLLAMTNEAVVKEGREVKICTIEVHGMEPVDGLGKIEFDCQFGAQVNGQETEVFEVHAGVTTNLYVDGAVAGDIKALCVEYRRVMN